MSPLHYPGMFTRLLFIAALLLPASALAATGGIADLNAVISGPNDIAVGRTLVLDASASTGLGESTFYRWYLNENPAPISRIVEAVYTPEKAGTAVFRLEIRTNIGDEVREVFAEKVVTVFERKVVLVADATVPLEKLQLHRQAAVDAGTYLRILQPETTGIPLATEESLFSVMKEHAPTLANADAIILWTEGVSGLQALMRAFEGDQDRLQTLHNQTIVVVASRGLPTLARTARGPFPVLQPDRIIVTRKEEINPLLSATNMDGFLADVEQRDIDAVIVDESTTAVRPWNLLSSLVNYMLTHGVSSQTVILLLMLPIIATILAFLKQVIGVTTFGLYTPSIVALSFLALGWKLGLLFLLFILITGYLTRAFMRRWRLLHIPKVAIVLSVVSITLLLLLAIGARSGIVLSGDTIFVLLIMSTLSENFLSVKTEEGLRSAVLGIGETILAALLCVFIVRWPPLQSLILAYPELIVLTFPFNALLGRWTGLRLVEYFRFQEVFRHLQAEE